MRKQLFKGRIITMTFIISYCKSKWTTFSYPIFAMCKIMLDIAAQEPGWQNWPNFAE